MEASLSAVEKGYRLSPWDLQGVKVVLGVWGLFVEGKDGCVG